MATGYPTPATAEDALAGFQATIDHVLRLHRKARLLDSQVRQVQAAAQ